MPVLFSIAFIINVYAWNFSDDLLECRWETYFHDFQSKHIQFYFYSDKHLIYMYWNSPRICPSLSSAYAKTDILLLSFSLTPLSHLSFWIIKLKGLIARMYKAVLNKQPCLTPFITLNDLLKEPLILICTLDLWYKHLIILMKSFGRAYVCNTSHKHFLETRSKAFFYLRLQYKSFLYFCSALILLIFQDCST